MIIIWLVGSVVILVWLVIGSGIWLVWGHCLAIKSFGFMDSLQLWVCLALQNLSFWNFVFESMLISAMMSKCLNSTLFSCLSVPKLEKVGFACVKISNWSLLLSYCYRGLGYLVPDDVYKVVFWRMLFSCDWLNILLNAAHDSWHNMSYGK